MRTRQEKRGLVPRQCSASINIHSRQGGYIYDYPPLTIPKRLLPPPKSDKTPYEKRTGSCRTSFEIKYC